MTTLGIAGRSRRPDRSFRLHDALWRVASRWECTSRANHRARQPAVSREALMVRQHRFT